MYEFDWANTALWDHEADVEPVRTKLSPAKVSQTLLVYWEEHCIECAPPECYTVCPLHVGRADGLCARFVYGLYPNEAFSGLLSRGADVRFRRWGKIQTKLGGRGLSVERHRTLDKLDPGATSVVKSLSKALTRISGGRRFRGAWPRVREFVLRRAARTLDGDYDEFVLECYAPENEPFRLILERIEYGVPTFRHGFEIEPGHNFHSLPAKSFGNLASGTLLLYPENDLERRVIFTWLDFVKYKERNSADLASAKPAAKVKVVAWDLDNTLWEGTLLEDGPEACALRPGVVELIKALDARGVLQTLVSKNDYDEAWSLVSSRNLADYFLYPAIHWGQKSESLRQIAERLNLSLDNFAVIDDSPFEREEVASALPMVRTYSPKQLASLLDLSEFDLPVTEMSSKRRLSYIADTERARTLESFRGDYVDFLRACRLRMRVFVPSSQAEVRRCHELLMRSNQLNLSARRYSEKELTALLAIPSMRALAVECEDRFGHYGIVCFCTIDEREETPLVRDFVLSCRVASKHVEQTFFEWLAVHERSRGAASLHAELVPTRRNGPLHNALRELGFRRVSAEDERKLLEMRLDGVSVNRIVEIRAEL
jgi:FkbH-like protein